MADYTQATRPIAVFTPLGDDVLLLVGFRGQEGISHLFHFQLDLIAENSTPIPFDQLLGQPVTIRVNLADGKERAMSGICIRVSQGDQDFTFTSYRMEIVPQLAFPKVKRSAWVYDRNIDRCGLRGPMNVFYSFTAGHLSARCNQLWAGSCRPCSGVVGD